MSLFSILMILTDDPNTFWVKAIVALFLISGLYFLFRFGLRRTRFSKKDLKAAGLNRQQQRGWRVINRRNLKHVKRPPKKTGRHF